MHTHDRLKMRKELSWKPVKRGNIYCSSACGAGCKLADYKRCVRAAKALAQRMGPGWKPYVSEKMHWYYGVCKGKSMNHARGFLEITPACYEDTYTAWVQSSPQFIVGHRNPVIALRMAVKKFDAYLQYLNDQRELISELL